MDKQFFILIGRSGAGKGTQALLLKKVLEEQGHEKVLHITTGGGFRDFIKQENYISSKVKEIYNKGRLQPEFLAVWNWSNIFINTVIGGETIILDGAPRKPFEVEVLHSAIYFLGYKNPVVIYLDVSESESRKHMASRGRSDDVEESDVKNKMDWFETDVLSTLEVYLRDPRYKIIHVNGNQAIENVHKEIMAKLEQ